jgi:hypothetical protein
MDVIGWLFGKFSGTTLAFQATLAIAHAEVVEPGLADGDRTVRELGIDADLIDDRVVAEPELERRVVA